MTHLITKIDIETIKTVYQLLRTLKLMMRNHLHQSKSSIPRIVRTWTPVVNLPPRSATRTQISMGKKLANRKIRRAHLLIQELSWVLPKKEFLWHWMKKKNMQMWVPPIPLHPHPILNQPPNQAFSTHQNTLRFLRNIKVPMISQTQMKRSMASPKQPIKWDPSGLRSQQQREMETQMQLPKPTQHYSDQKDKEGKTI